MQKQTKSAKAKALHIKTKGGMEQGCALKLENQLSALQDFVMMGQHDIMSHLHMQKEEYEKLLKLNDEEVEANGKPEITALNKLMYAMVNLGEAREALVKIIEKEPEAASVGDDRSYR